MSASTANPQDGALDQATISATISVKGNAERFAGESYYETAHIAHYHLASQVENKNAVLAGMDDPLAFDEASFIKRFKFDAPHCVREQVYRFKQERDVTDREIQLLKRSDALIIKGNQVSVKAGRWMYWLGMFLVVLATLYCSLWVAVFEYSHLTVLNKMIAEGFYAALFFVICWRIKLSLISPYRIVKRVGAWHWERTPDSNG